MALLFQKIARDGHARLGLIETGKGIIRTPAFMPVGTAATVKAMYPQQVRNAGADIVLGNTYHLMLRPGAKRINNLGGLHKFMQWPHPILTDSGGYQVMSLTKLRKLSEEGVIFRSHIDGAQYNLTPEYSLEIQGLLGSDIQMVFDECTPYPSSIEDAEKSMLLSIRWAHRSKEAFHKLGSAAAGYSLFGIVQGSVYKELREISAKKLQEIDFDGFAIGGLAVGEGQYKMLEVLDFTMPLMPANKPRYLMGVGTPEDIIESVKRGIDMFDCVIPTRSGRHGQAFTSYGKINLNNARHAEDPRPLDPNSSCPAAREYSRAYLHHLIKAKEILGSMLLSWINISYYQDLMVGIREAIKNGNFSEFTDKTKMAWEKGDINNI